MHLILTFIALVGLTCAYTDIRHKQIMVKNIDPIVLPGRYKSHMHTFFGSDAVTKDLPTTADLHKGCTSSDNPNDLSVYWIPTLYHVQNPSTFIQVPPTRFATYYHTEDAEIPYPANFFAVAGNATGSSQRDIDENLTGITWWCDGGPEDRQNRDRALFPQTACSGNLQVILRFPDCVDPADIKSYAYSKANGNRCPARMKRVPALRFSVRYNLRKIIPQGWTGTAPLKLACGKVGEGYCFHGDFINGWLDEALGNLMKAKDKKNWQRIDGPRGNGDLGGTCQPKDADPNGGTSDYLKSVEMMGSS
ncbi:hypothetical protein QBC43DRAFT_299375 [Cladorrhinum sp. PSN259]|nr:hypothetical protein QBC43DRAFT_299375 [Cladorrhinum sp. PSN259]